MEEVKLLEWLNDIICKVDNGYLWRELSEFDLSLREYFYKLKTDGQL